MERNFMHMIQSKWDEGKFLCIGLDIDYEKIPQSFLQTYSMRKYSQLRLFNQSIIDQTGDIACAYKPNIAFYEAMGSAGHDLLHESIVYIRKHAPMVPIILDFKRADIGNTNNGYVEAAFGENGYEVDAVTVNPYLGSKAMEPFLERKDKGIIVLCRTSNAGSGEFQDLEVTVGGKKRFLYEMVAENVAKKWNGNGNCMLVAGATFPKELGNIRRIVGDMPLLVPGVGTQGGDVSEVVKNGLTAKGAGIIINASSSVIFSEDPRKAALELHESIIAARSKVLQRT